MPTTDPGLVDLRPMHTHASHTSADHAAPASGLPLLPSPRELLGFPLGTVILRLGLLAESAIDEALAECGRTKRQLGRHLVDAGLLDEKALARALAAQKGLPFLDAEGLVPDPAAVRLLTAHGARTTGALPVGFENGIPVVAIGDPTDERVVALVREAIPGELVLAVAAPERLQDTIAAVYAAPAELVSRPAVAAVGEASAPAVAGAVYRIVLTLVTRDRLDIAAVADPASAEKRRRTVIDQLKRGTWPTVGERAIRPEAVVSVDVLETPLAS